MPVRNKFMKTIHVLSCFVQQQTAV